MHRISPWTWTWIKLGVGALLLLAGIRWLAVGLDLLPGSAMSGQPAWAAIGLAVALIGGWLLWATLSAARTLARPRPSVTHEPPAP